MSETKTKYIVNNATNQTINGDLFVGGSLKTNGTGVYKALLTQVQQISGDTSSFANSLIIGERYTISSYVDGDDFSNVANVVSGDINKTDCVFIATGQVASIWRDTVLTSQGNLVVDVIENTMGYDIEWNNISEGYYVGFNKETGPLINTFPKNKTSITSQFSTQQFDMFQLFNGVASLDINDDSVFLSTWNWTKSKPFNNQLFYTPIEINLVQDLDTTPTDILGDYCSFPFSYVSFTLLCGGQDLYNYYTNDSSTVNNVTELIDELNNNTNTNQIGIFSDNGDGRLKLTIPTNLKNQLCPNNELTFTVFSD